MVNSKIIKLREQECSTSDRNGSFKIELDQPILLKDQDVLSIKQVYLDTIASSGEVIELTEDITINMDVARYFINDSKDQVFPAPHNAERMRSYQPNAAGGIDTNGDGLAYFGVKLAQTAADTEVAKEIVVNSSTHAITHMVGGIDIVFQYTGLDNSTRTFTLHIPRQAGDDVPKEGFKTSINVRMKGKSMVRISPSDEKLRKHNIEVGSIKINYKDVKPAAGENTAELDIRRFSMPIKAGVYTPTQIGEIITDEMSRIDYSGTVGNNPGGGVFSVNNPFLGTAAQIGNQHGTTFALFNNQAGTQLIAYTALANMITRSEDRLIGASQASLKYDENHRKMSFDIIHTPIFVGESNPGAGNDGTPGLTFENTYVVNRYSGVVFTGLSATDSNGQPHDFWDNLGMTNCTATYENADTAIADNGMIGQAVVPIKVTAELGQQMTGAYEGNSIIVQKNSNFRKPSRLAVQSSDIEPIFGTKIFRNDVSNEGYYYVELDMGIQQQLTGAHGSVGFNSNKIHSIVGTYYQTDAYTVDNGQGSISYTHHGNPQILTNISVRILDCNGVVPDQSLLGNRNNVFLEVLCPN